MSAIAEAEFIRLLKKDISYFEQVVANFEELIPYLGAEIQDHWRLQAQARRQFALELMILLQKAEQLSDSSPAARD